MLNENFATLDQQDPSEFLSLFIDAIHSKYTIKYQKNNSLIRDFFFSRLLKHCKCNESYCGIQSFISASYESIINVCVHREKDIYELINETLAGENVNMYCPQCNDNTDHTVWSNFRILPKILMVLLKRYQLNSHATDDSNLTIKNRSPVHLKKELTLKSITRYENSSSSLKDPYI